MKQQHGGRIARRLLPPLFALLALSACGGGGDGATPVASLPPAAPPVANPPPAPQPEATRPQDTRSFSVVQSELPFTALEGAPDADRWWGVLNNAGYRIEVPKNWNGMLVMYAHGYAGTGSTLSVSMPPIRRHLLSQGYAWAASSYSKNYYDVRAGVEDTNALALAFADIARQNGRILAAPAKTYLVGVSMGGHVAAAAVDEENIAAAVHKFRYNAALPMCGVLGDTELFNYFAAYQSAAQQEAGLPMTSWPVQDWAAVGPQVQSRLFSSFPSAASPTTQAVPTAQGLRLKTIVQNLTGGPRPLFDYGYAGPVQAVVWSTFGEDGTLQGILNEQGVSTRDIVYQLDADPAVSAEELAYNATLFRIQPVPDANRARRDGLRWVPKTNAQIKVPVLTLHTLGDLYVPFSMEQIYKRRADAAATANLLVQRAIRGVSHCDFTIAEQVAAFEDLIKWEQQGVKPAGDDVLTPTAVADPRYGCKFTNNTASQDDIPLVLRARAQLPQCGP